MDHFTKGKNVNDALILIDHVNTALYSNYIHILDGRLNLFRHPGAWSHGVNIDIELGDRIPEILLKFLIHFLSSHGFLH